MVKYYRIAWDRGLHGPGTGPRASARPGPRIGPRPGSTDIDWFRPDSGLVHMIAIKRYIEHFGLSRKIIFFRKKQVIRSCAYLMLVTQLGSGNKSHRLDFLGDFCSCPLPEIVRDNTLHTCHPISLCRSSNAKIT
jgi:hypothetical protein